MFEDVLQEIPLTEGVGLDVVVGDAAEEDTVPLLLDALLVQVEATREKGDLKSKKNHQCTVKSA